MIHYFIENESKNCKCFHFCGLSTESFLAMWMCQYKCLMGLCMIKTFRSGGRGGGWGGGSSERCLKWGGGGH